MARFNPFGIFGRPPALKIKGAGDIFNEQTHVILPRPAVRKLQQGSFVCRRCKRPLNLGDFPSLSESPCPHCDTGNFIPTNIRDYWLYAQLASGHYSTVYKALSESEPDIELAMKLPVAGRETDPELMKSLLCEAEIGSQFGEHPHLVEIYDFGCEDGVFFMVMEHVDGVRLDVVADLPGRRPQAQVILWAMQILSALRHIHGHGYLYRALSPNNLIINTDGNVKMFDFGMTVKVDQTEAMNQNVIEGSFHFIPPERILGKAETPASEIYSLGLLMYRVLTHDYYFPGATFQEIAAKHVSPLRMENLSLKMPAGTHPDLTRIISHMIKCQPSERYGAYEEVEAELKTVFSDCVK
jgi:serine/threonine-protein kinase